MSNSSREQSVLQAHVMKQQRPSTAAFHRFVKWWQPLHEKKKCLSSSLLGKLNTKLTVSTHLKWKQQLEVIPSDFLLESSGLGRVELDSQTHSEWRLSWRKQTQIEEIYRNPFTVTEQTINRRWNAIAPFYHQQITIL